MMSNKPTKHFADQTFPVRLGRLSLSTRFLFFTGKGGVGKTSLSAATALTLADAGQRVLLVSMDAASNLDEMLGVKLRNYPVQVPEILGLFVLNIDPDTAAEAYRTRVLAQLNVGASDAERSTVGKQLSGACTTDIAAFDEFAVLLANESAVQRVRLTTTSFLTPSQPGSRCDFRVCPERGRDSWRAMIAVRPALARIRGSKCRRPSFVPRSGRCPNRCEPRS